MDISIVYNDKTRRITRKIDDAVVLLNGVQNYFHFTKRTDNVFDKNSINWDNFCQSYQPKDQYEIHITENPFDDYYFSHGQSNFSVITVSDWEENYAPPSLKLYMMYEIALSSIYFKADGIKIKHRTKGCLFDACMNKNDIKLGMRMGIIGPYCQVKLRRYGVKEAPINAVKKILDFVRQEAIGSPVDFNANAAFIVMPFSRNTESDHAYLYGIKPALQELGIECVMGRENVQSLQILEQIFNAVKANRFVIIQVDNDNLNVYFELGVAMGMDKDVLLISRPEFVKQIPADLTNWECLTYETGDYEDLKAKIIKYYKDNYHY